MDGWHLTRLTDLVADMAEGASGRPFSCRPRSQRSGARTTGLDLSPFSGEDAASVARPFEPDSSGRPNVPG